MAAWTPAAAVEATNAAGSSVRAANGSVGSGAGAYRVGGVTLPAAAEGAGGDLGAEQHDPGLVDVAGRAGARVVGSDPALVELRDEEGEDADDAGRDDRVVDAVGQGEGVLGPGCGRGQHGHASSFPRASGPSPGPCVRTPAPAD